MKIEPKSTAEIRLERRGCSGIILLDRPHALNALTLGMLKTLDQAIEFWRHDPNVHRIILLSSNEQAFCAGEDIRYLYKLGISGEHTQQLQYWRVKYNLLSKLKHYAKPIICMIDGAVLGAATGFAAFCTHAIAGDRFTFATPQVGFGYFPDAGGTYTLPRLSGYLGHYLALTGATVDADDAARYKIVTHRVASEHFAKLVEALSENQPVDAIINEYAHRPSASSANSLSKKLNVINQCFAARTVPSILITLDGIRGEYEAWAQQCALAIRSRSPTSVSIAFEQMRRGPVVDFLQAIRTEYRVAYRLCKGHDFYEGIRAYILEKDNSPKWRPARIDMVEERRISEFFEPLQQDELEVAA